MFIKNLSLKTVDFNGFIFLSQKLVKNLKHRSNLIEFTLLLVFVHLSVGA